MCFFAERIPVKKPELNEAKKYIYDPVYSISIDDPLSLTGGVIFCFEKIFLKNFCCEICGETDYAKI